MSFLEAFVYFVCVGAYFCLYNIQLRTWLQNHSSSTNLFISRNSHSTKMKNPQQQQITSKEQNLTGIRASKHAFFLRIYKWMYSLHMVGRYKMNKKSRFLRIHYLNALLDTPTFSKLYCENLTFQIIIYSTHFSPLNTQINKCTHTP